uniref:Uncharacterized protein n=1 Tax=Rhodosorus marinus TaxID=101924 RepID=A0A7S2ZKU5_9RHOD
MEACFVGLASSARGLRVSKRLAVQSRRRHCCVVACEKAEDSSGAPKIVRDVGLHESWYVYYEVRDFSNPVPSIAQAFVAGLSAVSLCNMLIHSLDCCLRVPLSGR